MFYGAKSGCGTYSMNIPLSKGGPRVHPWKAIRRSKFLPFFSISTYYLLSFVGRQVAEGTLHFLLLLRDEQLCRFIYSHVLTEHFAVLEPENPPIDLSFLVQKREALKSSNVRSGYCSTSRVK